MEIKLNEITVRELVDGYEDYGDDGVRGYGGKLDIRPPYQREFVYKDKQRNAVIESITQNFPLNVMYWSVSDDDNFEIIDGQQRTISIAQYVEGEFSVDKMYFHNLSHERQKQILDYKLMIYFCSGSDDDRLDWYRTINIAGEVLYEQEIRNAVYAGPWVSDARIYFSKRGCPAFQIGKEYLSGSSIRQDYLETAIKWISNGKIEDYMGRHQHDHSSEPLRAYFRAVIDWIESNFPNEIELPMKGEDWGLLYNEYKDKPLDPVAIADKALRLDEDEDVKRKAGIYRYILTGEEKYLNLRAFDKAMKRKVHRKQNGICNICKKRFALRATEADHITPWSKGGKTVEENCQVLCKKCNAEKSDK